MVFAEIKGPSTGEVQQPEKQQGKKIKELGELDDEFGLNFRPNEGQAAEHGVYYDDTKYDYMQHMKEIGTGDGPVTWVPASSKEPKGKGKNKMSLDDALRNMDLGGKYDDAQSVASSMASSKSLLPEELLGSEFVKKTTYQDMQDIPDAIAGFQPDMDPRLREVLEALEDEAYVNDEEEDFFAQLADGGEAVDQDDWEANGWLDEEDGAEGYPEEDAGWETDDTVKPDQPKKSRAARKSFSEDFEDAELPPPADTAAPPPSDPTNGAWIEEFAKFKQAVKEAKAPVKKPNATPSEQQSVNTGLSSLASGRRKKRKGAMTNPSAYSMTSSALARTDAQTLLDQRFDKIEEEYSENYDYGEDDSQFDDAESMVSGMTGMSKASGMSKMSAMSGMSRASGISTYSRATDSEAPNLVRTDFDSIMDGFLAGHSRHIGRAGRIKKAGYQTGMEQLDEVRNGLGNARLSGKAKGGWAR